MLNFLCTLLKVYLPACSSHIVLLPEMVVLSREEVNLIAQFLDIVQVSEYCVGLAGQV